MKLVCIIILIALNTYFCSAQSIHTDSAITTLCPDAFSAFLVQEYNPVILDARDSAHFTKFKLKTAIHAPTKKVLYSIIDSLDKDKPIFVYCEIGARSILAANELKLQGFKHIYNLENGIRNWQKEGYLVVKIYDNERK